MCSSKRKINKSSCSLLPGKSFDAGFIPKSRMYNMAPKCSPNVGQAGKIPQNLKQTNTHKPPKMKIQVLQGEMVPSLQEWQGIGWKGSRFGNLSSSTTALGWDGDFGILVDVYGQVEMFVLVHENSAVGKVWQHSPRPPTGKYIKDTALKCP